MSQDTSDQGRTIINPAEEMIDPTHPLGPGGAKKDGKDDVRTDPDTSHDPQDLDDPRHPLGEGGKIN